MSICLVGQGRSTGESPEGVCGGHVQGPPLPVFLNIFNPPAPRNPAAPGPCHTPLLCRSCNSRQTDAIARLTCISSPPQAQFCHVPKQHVLTMHDVSNIWRVPLIMESQSAHHVICK